MKCMKEQACEKCLKENGLPYKYCCLNECNEHEFCRGCVKTPMDKGEVSDGYHTFNELYYHRMILFSVIANQNKEKAWKSKLHYDGTMYENYFIVGIETPEGQFTYHYHLGDWDRFDVKEVERAPEWDGHKPEDVIRLLSIMV